MNEKKNEILMIFFSKNDKFLFFFATKMTQRFKKCGTMNPSLWDGTFQEFVANMVENDVPIQQKAADVVLAPRIHKVKFDFTNQSYTLTMDLIDGITLLEYVNQNRSTMTIEQLDQILEKVSKLYKDLQVATGVPHPDFAARNIMIGSSTGKYFAIDFECCASIDELLNESEMIKDHKSAMAYFCSDLSGSFHDYKDLEKHLFQQSNKFLPP